MSFNFGGGSTAPKFGESPGTTGFAWGSPAVAGGATAVTFDSPSAPATTTPAQTTPSSGFGSASQSNVTFGSSTTASGFGGGFGSATESTGDIKPMFGQANTPTAENPTPAAIGSAKKSSPTATAADDDANVDDSQLILPELKGGAFSATVTVTTGEEQEEASFSERSKMYIFYKEDKYGDEVRTNMWKERGKGQLKVLKHKVTGKYRLLMRQEATKKVICNAPISGSETLSYAANGKQVTLTVQDFDAEAGEFSTKTVAFKVRGPPEMAAFKAAFLGASGGKVTELTTNGSGSSSAPAAAPEAAPAAAVEAKQAATTSPPKISFGGSNSSSGNDTFTMGAAASTDSPSNVFSNLSMNTSKQEDAKTEAPTFGAAPTFGSGGFGSSGAAAPTFGSGSGGSGGFGGFGGGNTATAAFGANAIGETKASSSSDSLNFCDVGSLPQNQPLKETGTRRTQLIYKNVCARYRSLHNGTNPTTVVQCPGTAYLVGNRATLRHGMGGVVTAINGRGVVLCCGTKLASGEAAQIDHVQDHVVSFDNKSGAWSSAIDEAIDPKLGARHVVFQTDLPTSSPLSLGHGEAMSVALQLSQRVTSLGPEHAPIVMQSVPNVPTPQSNQFNIFVYGQGVYGNTMPTPTLSDLNMELVIAVGPTPKECGVTYSSDGDLELQCVALMFANKYQYKDVLDAETPTMRELFDADFAKNNVRKPAAEWLQFLDIILDQEDYSIDDILSKIPSGGEETTVLELKKLQNMNSSVRLKLKQHANSALQNMANSEKWIEGGAEKSNMKVMMTQMVALSQNLVDKKASSMFKVAKNQGAMCRVAPPANVDANYVLVALCPSAKLESLKASLKAVDGIVDVFSKGSFGLSAGYVNVDDCVKNDVSMEELLQDMRGM